MILYNYYCCCCRYCCCSKGWLQGSERRNGFMLSGHQFPLGMTTLWQHQPLWRFTITSCIIYRIYSPI